MADDCSNDLEITGKKRQKINKYIYNTVIFHHNSFKLIVFIKINQLLI